MYEFFVQPEKKGDCDQRNGCPRNPAGLYAGIYNADGYGVANIDRLGRTGGEGVVFLHEHIADNEEPDLHATTDEQWQSILDCIAAAPKMLAACKAMIAAFDHGGAADEAHALKLLRAAVAAAEPPALVRNRVSVTVEVEVETTPGEASLPDNVCMAAVDAVRDGEGTVVAHRIVSA